MLAQKWVFIALLSTVLPAQNNETNSHSSKEYNTTMTSHIVKSDNNTSTKISENNITHDEQNITKTVTTQLPKISEMKHFNGAWHLRVMDGMDVRKARAILDFNFNEKKTKLSGFDGCNRIRGDLMIYSEDNITMPLLTATRMACRQHIHRWVSKRLHALLKEGYSIKEETKYGIEGITLKSEKHELFFKKMGTK